MHGGKAFARSAPMNLSRAAAGQTKRGSPDYFTGAVWLDEVSHAAPNSRVRVVRVSFEPGARTAWHTHPHGQLIHVVSGVARVQRAGGEIVEALPGDSVWFEPGERHWHGAAPGRAMVHLAVQQADENGSAATWLERVSDAEYLGPDAR